MIASVYRDDPRLAPLISPGGPFEVEEVVLDGVPLRVFVRAPRTILDTFDMGIAHADLVHLVHDEERITFAAVRARALALAQQLHTTFGVQRGDRVAIAMRNLPEFVIGFWGAALLGAIVVPLNSWWTGAELGYALENAEARVAFLDDDRLARVIEHGRPAGVQLVGVRTDRTDADAPFAELVDGSPLPDDEITRLEPDDPVTILYTSGTTGRPKGALGTNRGHLHNIWNMAFGSAREAIVSRTRTRARPSASHPRRAADVPHRGHRRHHRQPDGRLEDPHHAQMGSRTRAPAGSRRGPHRVRGCARNRTPDHRVPRARGPRPRRARVPHGRRRGAARPAGEGPGALRRVDPAAQRLRAHRDHVGGGHQRGRRVRRATRQRGPSEPHRRSEGGRPERHRARRRRGRRAGVPLPTGGEGVLGRRGRHQGGVRRRLVPLRRRGLRRPRRLRVRRRPHQGRRDPRWRERLLRRGGSGALRASRRRRRRGRRDRRTDARRAGLRGDRAPSRSHSRPERRALLRGAQLASFKCPEALLVVDELPKTATEKVAKNVLRDRLAEPGAPVERMW